MKKLLVGLSLMFACAASATTIKLDWFVDGNTYAQTTCESGDDLIIPATPTKRGYHFIGWDIPDYVRLEYIESTGTQYIDTGYKPNINGYKAKLKIRKTDSEIRWTGVIGSFGSSVSASCKFGFDNTGKFAITAGSDISSNTQVLLNTDYIVDASIISGNISLQVNNQTILTSANIFVVPTSLNLWLFSYNRNGSMFPGESFAGRIYYTEIYDSDSTLVRNFIPAKRNSDNVIGMYDLVSGQFFTNAGTGVFIAGPVSANQTLE